MLKQWTARIWSPRLWAVVGLALVAYASLRYYQSSVLVTSGDLFIQQGKPEEAILAYQKALEAFPLRPDVNDDLKGARLILASDAEYGTIYQIGAEIQEIPPVSALLPVQLKKNEYHVPILMYHHIRLNPRPSDPIWASLNVSPQQLEQQLKYLADNNYHTLTLDDLYPVLNGEGALPPNPVILTFDDGYSSFYSNAFPLLKKYHLKAVSFVITGVLSASAYLSWDQIVEIDKSGLVQFAAHTRNHPSLVYLSAATIVSEIRGSKTDLEAHLKHPINWFAYPYGSYNDGVIRAVQDAGFVGAVSTIYGSVQSKDKIYLLPRIMVDGRYSLDNVIRRLSY